MAITGKDLAKLAEYVSALEFFAKLTPTSIDDKIVGILKKVGSDEELLDNLAKWLNWIPLFGAGPGSDLGNQPVLPVCLEGDRETLATWRTYLAGCDGDCDGCDN